MESGFKNLAEAEVQNTPPRRPEVAQVEPVGAEVQASTKSSEEAFDTLRTQSLSGGTTGPIDTALHTVGRGQLEGFLYFGTGTDLYGHRQPNPDALLATQDLRQLLRTADFRSSDWRAGTTPSIVLTGDRGTERPLVPGRETPHKGSDIGDSAVRVSQFLNRLAAGERPSKVDLQNIGDTISTLNSIQIAELRQRLEKDGGLKLDALKDDPRIPEAHRAAFGIHLKGNNERTNEDVIALGQNALKQRDLTLFTQAMRDASPEAREAFRQSLKPDQLKETFGKPIMSDDHHMGGPTEIRYAETRETRLAEDMIKYGEISLPSLIKEQTGILPTNRDAVKVAIDGISPEQRKLILDGERISFDLRSGRLESPTPEQQRSYELYAQTMNALARATNETEAYKWLDYLDGGGTRLISTLAGHRGNFYNGSDANIKNDINSISPADWSRGRTDHIYYQRTVDLLHSLHSSTWLRSSDESFTRSTEMLARKFDRNADTFDKSRTASDQVLSSIKFEGAKTFPDELSVLRTLSGIDRGSIARYAESPTYKEQLDGAVRAAMTTEAGKAIAERFLKDLGDGKRPELSLKEKVNLFTEDRLGMIDPERQRSLLSDIKEAMRKDPTLAQRLLNPGPEDRALVDSLAEAFPAVRADFFGTGFRPLPMQPKDGQINLFDAYVKPLAENGRLPLRVEASLGTHDRVAFTRIIADAPEAERKELLSDRRMQHSFFGYWTTAERDIAMQSARTGNLDPRDQLHLAILSGKKSDVDNALALVNPALRPLLLDSYKERFGDINQQLEQRFKGRELFDLKTEVLDIPDKARAAFGLSRDQYYRSRDGIFADIVHGFSGTGLLADNAHNRFASRLSESARKFEELPAAEKEKLFKTARESLRQFIESKDATADILVDTAITLATLPGTGGTSALLRAALLSAAARPSGRHLLLGDDHSGNYGRDAALGATLGLFNKLGPAQVSRLLGAGEEVAATASTAIAGRGLVSEANAGAFGTAMKQLVEDSLRRGGTIDPERLAHLSRAFAVPGSSALLERTIQTEITRATESTLGKFLKNELAPNGLSAGTGAGATQLAEGVLDDKPTAETLSRALTSFTFAFALGAGSTTLLRSPHLLREASRGDAAEEIFKRAVASPEASRREWTDFIARHKIDPATPRSAAPVDEFLEAPVPGRANLPISDKNKIAALPEHRSGNPLEERDVLTYKVKGRDLEIVIEPEYARKLDEIRQLRLTASRSADSDPQIAAAAQEALKTLKDHPLRDAVLPEQVLQMLPDLPNSSTIKRIELLGLQGGSDTTFGRTLADASALRHLRLFAGTDQNNLRWVLQHENAHFLQYKFGGEFEAFEAAGRVDNINEKGFFGRHYARKNADENYAVHFGEFFTNGNPADFALMAHAAPARAIAAAAMLKRALGDHPENASSNFHKQFAERINYIENQILPAYKQQMEAAFKSGDLKQIEAHLMFVNSLRGTEGGRAMAESLIKQDAQPALLKDAIRRNLANGDPEQIKTMADMLIRTEMSPETVAFLKEITQNTHVFPDGGFKHMMDWLAHDRSTRGATAMLELASERGMLDKRVVERALLSVPRNHLAQFLEDPATAALLKGKADMILSAGTRFDREHMPALFDAATKAGGPLTLDGASGLLHMAGETRFKNPQLSALAQAEYDKNIHRLGADFRRELAEGRFPPIGFNLKALRESPNVADRVALIESLALRDGKKVDGMILDSVFFGLTREQQEQVARGVRKFADQSGAARIDEILNRAREQEMLRPRQ